MEIRKAKIEELESIMEIYKRARTFMAEHGNPYQWGDDKPSREQIKCDIKDGKCYVCVVKKAIENNSVSKTSIEFIPMETSVNESEFTEQETIAAVFYYAVEEEPTYKEIFEGGWKSNNPYGVVHRIASAGTVKGAGEFCIHWALMQCSNLRIDTHEDNTVMQTLLKKCGFKYCGIIYLEDGTSRLAFQRDLLEKKKIFLKSLDFMRLGQAIQHEQWRSAAMTIQRMDRQAKEAGLTDFERLFTGIRQNINRKNGQEVKQLLALVVNKRVKMINQFQDNK